MAYAMGYIMPPLTGLRRFRFHYSEFYNKLLTQIPSIMTMSLIKSHWAERRAGQGFAPVTSRAPSALKRRICAASRNHRPV
jgi:hypothetical protein